MTASGFTWRRVAGGLILGALVLGSTAGCNGPTTVQAEPVLGPYKIGFSMDPQTLKPPQLSTLSYAVTDAKSGKPVNTFTPVAGALWHNVLISRDLAHFNHVYTDRVLRDEVSMLTFFPVTGKYYSYTIFQPANGDTQVYSSTIQAGDEGAEPRLSVDMVPDNVSGVRLELLAGANELRAGEPSQLVVYASERGHPVEGLWPYLGAPGYMWTLREDGQDFGFEAGTAPGRALQPTGTAEAGTPVATTTAKSTAVPGPQGGPGNSDMTPPTLEPGVAGALATRTAEPQATLAPAQQTAQASVLAPSAVQPAVGYGPYVAFTHVFPQEGLYKVWFEFQYRQQKLVGDWVVAVGK